jgi:hypothetical protein
MPARRGLVALVLSLAAFVAPMVAAVVVPDPTWIGGLYDGGDGDEAVALVWDHSSAVVPVGIALLGLIATFVAAAPAHAVTGSLPHCSPSSRAPPRA